MTKFAQLGADIAKLWLKYGHSYISGIENTLILALVGTLIGCLIGFICGILNTIPSGKNDHPLKRFFLGLIRVVIRIYVEVFRGTPMVLQAVFLYYGLPYFTDNAVKFTSVWAAAIVVVSINTGAYMAESVRGGIISVDPGQTEGAKAIGMTHVQTMTSVILPQALRNIMPQIGNNFIINVKDTSVMFIIGFPEFFAAHRAAVGASYLYFPSATVEMAGYLTMTELFFTSKSAAGTYLKFFEVFFITSCIYFVMTFTITRLLRWAEKKMDGASSYELVQVDPLTMTAGTYSFPNKRSPFDERNPEAEKSALRESLRRQIEREEALRQGQLAEQRRDNGIHDAGFNNPDQRGEG